mmetsp:Transcript_8423/g.22497  ORF Transcript_8423/g.22497 Transcript_8423/m.22497 type:complete len:213 (-) Transcript_8423:1524-2162(-)
MLQRSPPLPAGPLLLVRSCEECPCRCWDGPQLHVVLIDIHDRLHSLQHPGSSSCVCALPLARNLQPPCSALPAAQVLLAEQFPVPGAPAAPWLAATHAFALPTPLLADQRRLQCQQELLAAALPQHPRQLGLRAACFYFCHSLPLVWRPLWLQCARQLPLPLTRMQGAAGAWQMKDAHASTMGGIASLAFAAAAAAAAAVVAVAGGGWRAEL